MNKASPKENPGKTLDAPSIQAKGDRLFLRAETSGAGRMRIFYLANSAIPSQTANSIHVMKMCDNMALAGYEVSLLLEGRPPAWVEDPVATRAVMERYGVRNSFEISYVDIGTGRGRLLRFIHNLHQTLRRRKPDFAYGRSEMAIFVAAMCGIPCALELHNVVSARAWYIRWAARVLPYLKAYQGTVVISEALKRAAIAEIPALTRRKIVVAHDGADPMPKVEGDVRRRLQETGRMRLGYIGHLYPGKGMEIIHQMAEKMPAVDFHVVGGTEDDLRAWRNRVALPNLVFHGHVPYAEVPEFLEAMDVVLAPYQSRVEVHGGGVDVGRYMSPLKIFEYMSAGKAIICSDLPVLREILDESCAILASPKNVEEWVKATEVLREVTLRSHYGENAKARFEANYTWEKRVQKLARKFEWDT